jgi:hypothetical protein
LALSRERLAAEREVERDRETERLAAEREVERVRETERVCVCMCVCVCVCQSERERAREQASERESQTLVERYRVSERDGARERERETGSSDETRRAGSRFSLPATHTILPWEHQLGNFMSRVLILLHVSAYYYICVLILPHMCPHTTIYVSSYY